MHLVCHKVPGACHRANSGIHESTGRPVLLNAFDVI